jgi:hypothetical protein
MKKINLSEQAMRSLEERIPELADGAVKRAYSQALTSNGKVLEALTGMLVESSADGSQRVIRALHPPISVAIGEKRTRRLAR